MRKYFLTLDLEEWYHLEYIREFKSAIASKQRFVPQVLPFLRRMAEEKIYLTVFVLGEVARDNSELVKEIADMGHEVGCHGWDHGLVYKVSDEQFENETRLAKRQIEEIIGSTIQGYRASCFSMENSKLDILWNLGFTYDASLIRFKEHSLYNVLDMSSFNRVESMIYKDGDKYEFETPTLEVLGRSVPISGGGYFRLFPLSLMKKLMKKHWHREANFVFYIHPFELTSEILKNGRRMGPKNYFRFQVGRNNMNKKLLAYIEWLKEQEVEFMPFKTYIESTS